MLEAASDCSVEMDTAVCEFEFNKNGMSANNLGEACYSPSKEKS